MDINLEKKFPSIFLFILALGLHSMVFSQTETDSLSKELRHYVARNFSEARTFNLYWETGPSHSYTLKQNGRAIENEKIQTEQIVKFQTTIPILLHKKFSLYANGQANFYMFDVSNDSGGSMSSLFSNDEESHQYYKAGISSVYKTRFVTKPLIISTTISGDAWNKSFEKIHATLSAISILKSSKSTTFGVGLHAMSLYSQIPILPLIIYGHQFNPNLSIDVVLPNRAYLRYQFCNNHRLSIGATLESENFYLNPNLENVPKTSLYQRSSIKSKLVYEYIINNHFYITAQAGVAQIIKSGLYGTNRKGIDKGDPYVEYNQPMTPFFYFGFSYNLFK
ncbi:MAG: hypothetical protein JKX79_02510 [Labilibaculum sp.]|nr:hypothetical protein [Labilibaculum sp.]